MVRIFYSSYFYSLTNAKSVQFYNTLNSNECCCQKKKEQFNGINYVIVLVLNTFEIQIKII